MPTPVIIGLLLAVMLLTAELARRAGARHVEDWPRTHDPLLNLSTATLALLGLMLAFSFSLSVGRFQARQAVLLSEANAITAVDMLADLLQPAAQTAVLYDLHSFTELRILFLTVGHDPPREQAAARASHDAVDRIWLVVTEPANYREPVGQSLSLMTRAVVDLVNAARTREIARAILVPQPLLVMLFVMSVLACTMVAYNFRASGLLDRSRTVAFMLVVCMVLYVVIDLDRPRRGLMKLDPAPLQHVLDRIAPLPGRNRP